MSFLGVDQSLRAPGVCSLAADGTVEALFTIDPGKRRGAARLAYIEEQVAEVLTPATRFVCLEGYAYDSVSRHFALGEVGGVLQLLAYKLRVPALAVAPAALKKFATGKSTASKEAMCEAATAAGVNVGDEDDQADAFFLASIARYIGLGERPRKRAQLEVLHQLQHPAPKKVRRIRRFVKNAF